VGALSVPFYVLGAFTRIDLLPRLPISAVATVCPAAAALILSRRQGGDSAAWSLLRGAVDIHSIIPMPTIAAAILVAPAAEWVSYLVPSALASSTHITPISPGQLVALATAFLVAAIGEELGWSGYALGRLQSQSPMLRVGLEIGVAWAAWHVLPLVSVGRSAEWVAWWAIGTIAQRVVFVWLYRATGRNVGVVALSHALRNLVWMLIPTFGSEYDPRADAIATIAVAAAVVAISGRVERAGASANTGRGA
jgi:membrane protease YdiL (CAAX protease family)